MKVFEFIFNPGDKQDLLFDSFCYEPGSSQEQKLGSLYIIGELKNALPQDSRLINNLAFLLKREYYSGSSAEATLKKALKKANDFLSEKTKLGNVSWLGNLSLTVISLHDLDLIFSKDGKTKVLLLRPGHITDIGKTLEIEEFEPYPLKIFTNIVGGKFLENDKIIVLTEEVFEFFSKTALLEKISLAPDQKALKELFQDKEKEFSHLRGICFLLFLTKEISPKSELIFKKMATPLSLKDVFSPTQRFFSAFNQSLRRIFSKLDFSKLKLKLLNGVSLPKINWPQLKVSDFKLSLEWENKEARRNLLLIFILVSFLILGFLFAQKEEEIKARSFRDRLISLQEKVVKAQGYLALSQNEKANNLFKEAFEDTLPLSSENSSVSKEALVLKALVEKNLVGLSQLEELPDPRLLFSFANQNFVPQHLVVLDKTLYFFSPYEREIVKLVSDHELERIGVDEGFSFAVPGNREIILFTKPNKISFLTDDKIELAFSLKLPDAETSFAGLSSFKGSLYFLEKGTGKIFKYQYPLAINREEPQSWIQAGERKPLGARSIGVTGSVFILSEDNSIWEYQAGQLKKIMNLSVFPFPKRLIKLVIWPPFSRFAILEPSEKRVILINRSGSLIKQFRSEKFLGLKDAAFSSDGKFLYLLSGLEVYQLEL
ncbi:MAG: hypothetical protein Q8N65_02705 [bacterium]|nr:hypothetical protein [bacterium]